MGEALQIEFLQLALKSASADAQEFSSASAIAGRGGERSADGVAFECMQVEIGRRDKRVFEEKG